MSFSPGICSNGVCIAHLNLAVGDICGLYLGDCPSESPCGGIRTDFGTVCGGDGTTCTNPSQCAGGLCTADGLCGHLINLGDYCNPERHATDICAGTATCAPDNHCGGAGATCVADQDCAFGACSAAGKCLSGCKSLIFKRLSQRPDRSLAHSLLFLSCPPRRVLSKRYRLSV